MGYRGIGKVQKRVTEILPVLKICVATLRSLPCEMSILTGSVYRP